MKEWVFNRLTEKIDSYYEPMLELLKKMLVVMEQIRDQKGEEYVGTGRKERIG